ncbi:hypothetical protein [Mesorhizobium amorphae]
MVLADIALEQFQQKYAVLRLELHKKEEFESLRVSVKNGSALAALEMPGRTTRPLAPHIVPSGGASLIA